MACVIPEVQKISVDMMKHLIAEREFFWPGDVILSQNPHGRIVRCIIRPVQYLALRDLETVDVSRSLAWQAARYTHAMIASEDGVLENTYPRCRFRSWNDLRGTEILWCRPCMRFLGPHPINAIGETVDWAREDVERGTPYPTKELGYYGKWATKIFRKHIPGLRTRSFFELFEDGNDDIGVCSAMVMLWYRKADVVPIGERTIPNAWYPARFAVDPYFSIRGNFSII